jgi:protein-S-isoprenylcysteine O-methyltransferase Ste14
MDPVYSRLVGDCWLVFLLYWLVSARRTKPTAYRAGSRTWCVASRILLIALIILVLRLPSSRRPIFGSPAIHIAGLLLCAAGIGFAIWARRTLGANWSPVPSIKEGHELVSSGPYRFVRHPIYTGIWLAMLGSTLAGSGLWFVGLVFASALVAYRVKKEDGLMSRQFPASYPQYVKRTKAVIPFVL